MSYNPRSGAAANGSAVSTLCPPQRIYPRGVEFYDQLAPA
jgi:hypothetical protein